MGSRKNVKYKCPYCDVKLTKEDLIRHVEDVHEDLIPEGYTAFRLVFNYINKKPIEYQGKCTECGGKTEWDEIKGRYNRQCNKPACRESFIKKFEANMIKTRGVKRISQTPEGQEKMLAARKISGTYKFQSGEEKTYTGKYELAALKFLDQVMNIDPQDIMCPGPILEYQFEGKTHIYITDFYYQPYNLIIEVKDGGKRPNNREMPVYRAKQIAKEQFIIKNTNYNYLRLTDNDLSQLLAVMADLKMQMVENTGERVIHINEAMNALMTGYIPGIKDTGSVYIVNYMKNNVFSGETEEGYGITDNIKLDNLICRNKEGILSKAPSDFLENASYNVYMIEGKSSSDISKLLSPYMDQFVEEGFIYESLFGHKMCSYDQIDCEESAIEVLDYYKYMDVFKEVTMNYIKGNNNDKSYVIESTNNQKYNLKNGNFIIRSSKIPELFIESNKEFTKDCIERKVLEAISLEVE